MPSLSLRVHGSIFAHIGPGQVCGDVWGISFRRERITRYTCLLDRRARRRPGEWRNGGMRQRAALLTFIAAGALPVFATITVTLVPNLAGPQPVGTSVTWTATVADSAAGAHDFRFTARRAGEPVRILRDFGTSNVWTWTHSSYEGDFILGVVVRNSVTKESAAATANYGLRTRLVTGLAAINPTRNPLVALFSGPPCLKPNSMRVRFRQPGAAESQTTGLVRCRTQAGIASPDLTSMNVYVAGMYPRTTYMMRWETVSPAGATVLVGAEHPFTTGALPPAVNVPTFTIKAPPPAGSEIQPVLIENYLNRGTSQVVTATDLLGRLLWYYDTAGASIDRTTADGTMLYRKRGATSREGIIAEIDLAGNQLVETNVARVSEQLVAHGYRRIVNFSHEVRRIFNPGKPNDGFIVVIGGTDMISTVHQGGTPENPVDILGDEIIVLDQNLQLAWAWNPFQHLDVSRAAVLGEICTPTTICKPYTPGFTRANDWLHTNSVQYTPWDGNLIASLRSQDWVIKINYAGGAGDGRVLWRMGPDGDFSITTNGAGTSHDIGYPWFSHQHDAEFELRGATFGGRRVMTVYDNGNTRRARFNRAAHSRCQSFAVDEANRTVNLNINADTGVYAEALGSAQLLGNGNLNCTGGSLIPSTTTENDRAGAIQYHVEWPENTYRTLRMRDLYTPGTP